MSSIFPALAKILLQEDDPEVLEVARPFNPLSTHVSLVVCCVAVESDVMAKTGQKLLSTLISSGYDEISHWTSSDGKRGLEILMLIIEKSLNPLLDESQRILAGPLITDLAIKVIPPENTHRCHP